MRHACGLDASDLNDLLRDSVTLPPTATRTTNAEAGPSAVPPQKPAEPQVKREFDPMEEETPTRKSEVFMQYMIEHDKDRDGEVCVCVCTRL